jgi:hypothetical protein
MDVSSLQTAYAEFIEMASSGRFAAPENQERWTAELIVAHIAAIDYLLVASISGLLAGRTPDHNNLAAIRAPLLGAIVAAAGDWPGLIDTVRKSSAVVCALASQVDEETAARPFPTLFQSGEKVVFDGAMTLAQLVSGQVKHHLPGHLERLRALKSSSRSLPASGA